MIKIGIIIGSTRPGRNGDAVARWTYDLATKRGDAVYEIVDLAEYSLPHLDEPMPAAYGQYNHAHTKAWSEKIASFDGFIFVTPEYNSSTPGALKNALDFLHAEWADKAAGIVSYGVDGGARAAEHLRQVLGRLRIADVSAQVTLSIFNDFENMTAFKPAFHKEEALTSMLDQLVAWGTALHGLRSNAAVAA